MQTYHQINYSSATHMREIDSESIDLVVTSPPYPMIQMWDDLFGRQDPEIAAALDKGDGMDAYDRMHSQLAPVWREIFRVLKSGGIACINIGDAVRSMDNSFALYPNHARIFSDMLNIGFSALPQILWRKQTNAPNKFMGSGMLPPSAYVTLEHEHIIIMRKGGLRDFTKPDGKQSRRLSAYFWEERNLWFSDVWMDLKGTRQGLSKSDARSRSAAFPFEIPYRLINMFSVQGDTVLDPFLGTGTTTLAAMASGRNSSGIEIERSFEDELKPGIETLVEAANSIIDDRLAAHFEFVRRRSDAGQIFKHRNIHYGFPVMTRQEVDLLLKRPLKVTESENGSYLVDYGDHLQSPDDFSEAFPQRDANSLQAGHRSHRPEQRRLFK